MTRVPSPRDVGLEPSARAGADLAPPGEDYAASPWDDGPAAPATIRLEATEGLDLAAVSEKSEIRPLVPEGARPPEFAPRSDVDVWLTAAKELFALGDFTGSLELIEKVLQVDPDHGEARDYLAQNEATLVSMYESKLGSLGAVPQLAIKPEEVMWLNLDHRAGVHFRQEQVRVEDLESLCGARPAALKDHARAIRRQHGRQVAQRVRGQLARDRHARVQEPEPRVIRVLLERHDVPVG
jgi:hypothetical protein